MRTQQLQVTHFQRSPAPGQVSVERLFEELRRGFPEDISCKVRVCPYPNQGVLPRLRALRWVAQNESQLNHVTGDVHYLTLALPGKQTLLTILDCVSLRRLRGLKRRMFRLFWYELPVSRAGIVSVISEATRVELMREVKCDARKIRVVHCCVRSEFKPAPKEFLHDNPLLLQVGTGENKNIIRVAQSLKGLPCRLKILGELSSNQRSVLAECKIPYTNVGRATDAEVLQAYQECDAVIFASTYEGFGLPVIEANAVGRPVIAGNVASLPEVAGNAACLVDPLDVAAIRGGVLRVANDASYRQQLIQAGFENVKRFSPSAIAAQYAALYRELAANCCV